MSAQRNARQWWVVTILTKYPDAWRSLGRELTHRDGITLEEAAEFVAAYDGGLCSAAPQIRTVKR